MHLKMNNLRNISYLVFLLIFTGCAANINEVVKAPLKQEENITDTIYLNISYSHSLTKNKDLTRSIAELQKLISKDYQGNVSEIKSQSKSGITVDISFEHYRYVSGFGRFMAGVLVGDAELKLSVKIIDLASNQVIGESILDTRSEFSEGIFGATTSRQLEAMSKKIVSIITSSEVNSYKSFKRT